MLRFGYLAPVLVALTLTVIVAGCGDDGYDNNNGSSSPEPTTVSALPTQPSQPAPTGGSGGGGDSATRVSIVDFGYGPENINARAGELVTLEVVNNGAAPHTFTITGVVDSGTLNSGQTRTVSFTPSAAGTLQFLCTIHGAGVMSGTVTVQ